MVLLSSSPTVAFETLSHRISGHGRYSTLFGNGEGRATLWDGLLLGEGTERTELLPNGHLRVLRTRTYTRARHPDSGKVVSLPEPWHIQASLELTASLRLVRSDTTLELHPSVDRALGYPVTEKMKDLFGWDEARIAANPAGNKLTRDLFLRGHMTEHTSYDYPAEAIPIEIVGLTLSVAVRNRVERFNFELLLPDGATHGVRSEIHRTRYLRPFAEGYPIPISRLHFGGELAVVDMCLSSPFKYLLFPHHFYFVYSSENPEQLLALWGGDPSEHLQAIREP